MAHSTQSPSDPPAVASPCVWYEAQRILEILSSLSYRSDNLAGYLDAIARGVSELIGMDWSVVTLCQDGMEEIMASSLNLGQQEHIYSLHGSLTHTVVETGQTLAVEDAIGRTEYGDPPEGYTSYLGVPLRTAQGDIIGTICSFCVTSREFSLEEVRIAELFAERAATAIDNYRLYQQQRQFNEMLEAEVHKRTEDLKTAQAQLIEQERLAAIGQFAAMIVHEIRNPMTTIRMGLNFFKKIHTSGAAEERAALALEETHRLENLLSEILLFAKPQVLQPIELEINEFLHSTLETLREMPEVLERQLCFVPLPTPVKLRADKDKLKQVLINLIRNACEAIASGETVTCRVQQISELSHVQISVHNGGMPIPSEVLPRLTEPFCSTKSTGTGLGLTIVKRIVDAHQGMLSIQSDAETGTIVRVTLPSLNPVES